MPPLLHGLGYLPELSDISDDPNITETLSTVQENSTSIQMLTCNSDDVEKASLSKASDLFSFEGQQNENATANEAILEESTTTATSQYRKKTPRIAFTLGGPSPFPDRIGPTAEACQQVYNLLSRKHEKREMPASVPPPSQTVAGCGEVSFVLEALIRTIISTHTHMSNADKAIRNVCKQYPVFQHGDFAGSVDWNVVRISGFEKLEEAIRPAGKAKTTSTAILSILESVKHENDLRRKDLLSGMLPLKSNMPKLLSRADILSNKANEMLLTAPDFLTLDYLHAEPAKDVFERLQLFPGVGVKTAACILLFCLQYPAFAVDTHVWRLCKLLDWVPTNATRDQTFFFLDPTVPDALKYGLHQLFIAHGKTCVRCSGRSKENDDLTQKEACVLEDLITRSNINNAPKKKKKKRSSKKRSLDERSGDAVARSLLPVSKSDSESWHFEEQTPFSRSCERTSGRGTKEVSPVSETEEQPVLDTQDPKMVGNVRRSKRIAKIKLA